MPHRRTSAFTLIELLVVIAIISLLASIVFFSLTAAKAKASDAKKITEAGQVQTALELYYQKNGTMPPNYSSCSSVGNCTIAPAGALPTPAKEGTVQYDTVMNLLVSQGDLTSIPTSPDQSYNYYNYGPNTPQGVVFGATLQVTDPTTVMQPTCQTKTDPASLYPGLQSYSPTGPVPATQYLAWIATSGSASADCYMGPQNFWMCEYDYTSNGSEYCEWSANKTFTNIIGQYYGNDCAPVTYATECTGTNFCTCNPY